MKKAITVLMFLFFTVVTLYAAGITFTFANVVVTGSNPSYCEFDIMAHSDVETTRLGDNLIYINYSTLGFGSSVVSEGKVTVEKGSLLEGGSAPSFYYSIINIVDNTPSRFAITTEYNYPDYPEYGNILPTTPTQLLHIKIEVVDSSQNADLSFEENLMVGQQYESDNSTVYSPVDASDTADPALVSPIIELVEENIPSTYVLNQNYPNPFNPVTTIEYGLPKISNVKIEIFNVLGQRVFSFSKIKQPAGYYKFNIDGYLLASGLYFYRLIAGQNMKIRKMILLK